MKYAILNRITYSDKQTLGDLSLYAEDGHIAKLLKTLELADKDNQPRISCIPKGSYIVKFRPASDSASFNHDHYHVQNVEGRSWILFHRGNYNHQIKGCILPGISHSDINKDGELDVVNSTAGMDAMIDHFGKEDWTLIIK